MKVLRAITCSVAAAGSLEGVILRGVATCALMCAAAPDTIVGSSAVASATGLECASKSADGVCVDPGVPNTEAETGASEPEPKALDLALYGGFTVPVSVRAKPEIGAGHYGVFTEEDVPKGKVLWTWNPSLVESIHKDDILAWKARVARQLRMDRPGVSDKEVKEAIAVRIRRGFVLPNNMPSMPFVAKGTTNEDYFNDNPEDPGRYTNHADAEHATLGDMRALRDLEAGEELTMDYNFHGNPAWYVNLCREYAVQTENEVAQQFR